MGIFHFYDAAMRLEHGESTLACTHGGASNAPANVPGSHAKQLRLHLQLQRAVQLQLPISRSSAPSVRTFGWKEGLLVVL